MASDELLDRIASVEFEAEVVASTPRVLREILRRKPEVDQLRERYDEGLVSDDLLRQFVNGLLERGDGEERFPYQTALAAVAVMLEPRFKGFADEYLTDLGRIQSARFAMASRVARECLRARAGASQYQTRTFIASEKYPAPRMHIAYCSPSADGVTEGSDWQLIEMS